MVLGIKPRASQVLSKHSTAEPPLTHPGHPKGSGLEAELWFPKHRCRGPDSSEMMKALTDAAQLQNPLSLSGQGRARHTRIHTCTRASDNTYSHRVEDTHRHACTHAHGRMCDNTYSHGVEEVGSPLTALEGLQRRRRC